MRCHLPTFAAVILAAAVANAADVFMANGVTKPTEQSAMSFIMQGLVKDVLVKPGDVVQKGQPLVQLDDSIEKAQMNSLAIDANSDVKIKAADADLAKKRIDLANKQQIFTNGGANESEVQDAQLAVTIGELSVALAKEEAAKKRADVEAQQKKIEKMVMLSPLNGVVDKIDIDPGAVIDPQKAVVTVIDNSKLKVEASLPTDKVNKLHVGDTVQVRYESEPDARQAKIIFLSPAADAASSTRLIRAEMANPEGKPSGMSIEMRLPDSAQTAEAK